VPYDAWQTTGTIVSAVENRRAKTKKKIRIMANGVERDGIEARRTTEYVGECERKGRCSSISAGRGTPSQSRRM
jgi:hypothetical protein